MGLGFSVWSLGLWVGVIPQSQGNRFGLYTMDPDNSFFVQGFMALNLQALTESPSGTTFQFCSNTNSRGSTGYSEKMLLGWANIIS